MKNLEVNNKRACLIIGMDRKTQGDELATGHLMFIPSAAHGMRFWGVNDLAAGRFYIDQRRAGFTVKQAGQLASRLARGMRDHPSADQLTVVTLENGSMSTLPTAALDLSSGFVSGGYVATATMIDVRNLRLRVQRAIEADAVASGGDGDA